MTARDAEKFGVPAGLPILDATTAQAEADVIEMHTVNIKGEVLASGEPTTLHYSEMQNDLFVGPEDRAKVRTSYLNGLTLRNALSLAIMGFGIADLAIGTGVLIMLLGVATIGIGVPAIYWATQVKGKRKVLPWMQSTA